MHFSYENVIISIQVKDEEKEIDSGELKMISSESGDNGEGGKMGSRRRMKLEMKRWIDKMLATSASGPDCLKFLAANN